jgi:hypothetical protein
MAVGGLESQLAGYFQHLGEIQGDGRPCKLRYLVFDGKVEVVGTIEQAFEGALILS